MPESMTLIEQANVFNKLNHLQVFSDQQSSINDELKSLSLHVFSSQYLISNEKQTRYHRSNAITLPSLNKDENRYRRKTKPPTYRTARYRSKKPSPTLIDLPLVTSRGTKSELLTTIQHGDTINSIDHQQTPPPSPSDEQLERLLYEFTRTKQSTPNSLTNMNDHVPYRLPALKQSSRQAHSQSNFLTKNINSTLSNYF